MLAWDEAVTSEMAMLWVHNGKRQIREEKSKPARGSDDDEISDPPAPPRKGADKSASRSASRPKSSPDASSTAWVFNDVSEEDRQAVAAVVDLRLMVARKLDLTDCDRDVAEAEVAALLCVPVDVVRRCAGARGVQPKRVGRCGEGPLLEHEFGPRRELGARVGGFAISLLVGGVRASGCSLAGLRAVAAHGDASQRVVVLVEELVVGLRALAAPRAPRRWGVVAI